MKHVFNVDFDFDLADFDNLPTGMGRLDAVGSQFITCMAENPVFKGNCTIDKPCIADGWVYMAVEIAYEHPGTREHARNILRAELRSFSATKNGRIHSDPPAFSSAQLGRAAPQL